MDLAVKKQVLRLFTYGLYAISCAEGNEVNAFTANWLTQVSFEPPLIALSIENDAKSLPIILRSRQLAINVFRHDDASIKLSGHLGKSAIKHPDKLQGLSYERRPDNYVILHDCLGWSACEVQQVIPTGDSTLVVAQVVDVGLLREGQPLTMAAAGFRHAG